MKKRFIYKGPNEGFFSRRNFESFMLRYSGSYHNDKKEGITKYVGIYFFPSLGLTLTYSEYVTILNIFKRNNVKTMSKVKLVGGKETIGEVEKLIMGAAAERIISQISLK